MKRKKIYKAIVGSCLILLLLVGCASQNMYDQTAESKQEMAETTSAEVDLADKGQEIELTLNNQLNRKIIKRGQLEIESKDFEKTIQTIAGEVEKTGGFIESSQIEGNSYYNEERGRYGEFVVRIPNEQFESFVNGAESFGNVVSKGMNGEDVTDAYVDIEARLKSLEVQRERLLELLKKSGTLEELFAIEKEYANVTYEIEQLQGKLNQYDSLIDYSTITLTIREVRTYQNTTQATTLGERMMKQFQKSMQDIKQILEKVVIGTVGMIPFIIVIGLPILVGIKLLCMIWQRLKKNKSKE